MSQRIVCDSCDDRVKLGTTCVQVTAREEGLPVPVTRHYHDLCWQRQMDVLLPKTSADIVGEVTLSRRPA